MNNTTSMSEATQDATENALTPEQLDRLTASDPAVADAAFLSFLKDARGDGDRLLAVLNTGYLPRRPRVFNLYCKASLAVVAVAPVHACRAIPRCYNLGRPVVARKLVDAVLSADVQPRFLRYLADVLVNTERDYLYLAAVLARIAAKLPGNVTLSNYQIETANRMVTTRVLADVPPVTRAILMVLPERERLRMLDGGATASEIETAFANWPRHRWEVFGFDPHPDADLSVEAAGNVRMIRTALARRAGTVRLYRTPVPAASSLYEPNDPYLRHLTYADGRSMVEVSGAVDSIDVQAVDLDTWRRSNAVPPFDFVKLNVQGAELDIIEGAFETMSHCLGVQLEVSFAPTYRGAPQFRDLDQALNALGFTLFDFRKVTTVGRTKRRKSIYQSSRVGVFRWPSRQMTEAHVLYLRDPLRPEHEDDPRWSNPVAWLKLAMVAELQGQIDLAMQLCEHVVERFAAVLPEGGRRFDAALDEAERLYRQLQATHF